MMTECNDYNRCEIFEDSEAVPGGYSEWGHWVGSGYDGYERSRQRVFWPLAGCRTGNGGAKFGTKVVCGTKWQETEFQGLS